MTRTDVDTTEFNPYYALYIGLVDQSLHLVEALEKGGSATVAFFKTIPEGKLDYRYAEGKWTPKEILLHLIDTERIFSYRALRFSRNDFTELVGFDQDELMEYCGASKRTLESLLEEYVAVRAASVALYKNLTDIQLEARGVASASELSCRAAGFIIAGHERSHIAVLKERYLN